jgi:DNA-binding MarR family transcriptional regulator
MCAARAATATTAIDPAQLAARFRQALIPLTRQLRTQVEPGITPGMMSALGTVRREGPVALGDLAAAEKVTPPMATKLANGLVDAGLVERLPCEDDRRVVRLQLTDAGRDLLERAAQRRNAWLATRFADLTDDELAALDSVVGVIERLAAEPDAR